MKIKILKKLFSLGNKLSGTTFIIAFERGCNRLG